VPYEDEYIANSNDELMKQAEGITADLAKEGIEVKPEKEIVALIAYLQRLGTDIKVKKTQE
jgi:cytochrome c oxidase cbb3-type subunit I/II